MLTLTRKLSESILIGNVRITVTKIHGGKVRLGIDAPKDVAIVRTELLARRTEVKA
jgi:carbon storage regulator